jgi:hypothetical protein
MTSGIKKINFKIGATEFGVQVFKTPRFVIEIYEISDLTGFVLGKKSLRSVSKVCP